MSVSLSIEQHRIVKFLGAFQGMKDLVLVVERLGSPEKVVLSGAGTCERSYFIKKWLTLEGEGEDSEGYGNIPIGQLELFKNLLANSGHGIVNITYDGGHIQIVGQDLSFSIPPVADATSQAGVELMEDLLKDQPQNPINWKKFGSSDLTFNLRFDADKVRAFREAGKAIQNGALYTLRVNSQEMVLTVARDQINVQKTEEVGEWSNTPDDTTTMTFGRWLMDALKAMPSAGSVYLIGGEDSPLLIRHTPPEDDDGNWGTVCIVAPRQEEAGV